MNEELAARCVALDVASSIYPHIYHELDSQPTAVVLEMAGVFEEWLTRPAAISQDGPVCRLCGADCSGDRNWSGGDDYLCSSCAKEKEIADQLAKSGDRARQRKLYKPFRGPGQPEPVLDDEVDELADDFAIPRGEVFCRFCGRPAMVDLSADLLAKLPKPTFDPRTGGVEGPEGADFPAWLQAVAPKPTGGWSVPVREGHEAQFEVGSRIYRDQYGNGTIERIFQDELNSELHWRATVYLDEPHPQMGQRVQMMLTSMALFTPVTPLSVRPTDDAERRATEKEN